MKFIINLLGNILVFLLVGLFFSPLIYAGLMYGNLGLLLIGIGGVLYSWYYLIKEERRKKSQ